MNISDYFKNYNFLFDSHAHLSTGSFEITKIDELFKRAKDNGVERIFDIGVDLKSSKEAIRKAATFANVAAFVGIDPEVFEPGSEMFVGLDIDSEWLDEQEKKLNTLVSKNIKNIAGIGETGMDFFHFKNQDAVTRNKSIKFQNQLFKIHLKLALQYKLPLSIHSRGAEKECLEIVKKYPEVTGIFHSFTGDYETAVKILDAGWGLGVNGIVTFKSANDLRDLYRKILGKIPQSPDPQYFYSKGIFFETDAPYLSPEGKRGKKNEPANVKIVYDNFIKMLQN